VPYLQPAAVALSLAYNETNRDTAISISHRQRDIVVRVGMQQRINNYSRGMD